MSITVTNVKEWMSSRKALSVRQIEREAGVPISTFQKYLRGFRQVPEMYQYQIYATLVRYGFDGEDYDFS